MFSSYAGESNVLTFERTLKASAATVWAAWTEPEKLSRWWGQDGVKITECEIDLRVGGNWYIVMEAGETMGDVFGMRWPMRATYTDVMPHTRLAYTAQSWVEGAENTTMIEQTAQLLLAEKNGETEMTLTISIHRTGPDARMAVKGMEWGYNQQFDALERFVKIVK